MQPTAHGAVAASIADADPDEASLRPNYTVQPMGDGPGPRHGRLMLHRILTGYTTPVVLFTVSVGLIAAQRAEGLAWSALVISLALVARRADDAPTTPGPQGRKAGAR